MRCMTCTLQQECQMDSWTDVNKKMMNEAKSVMKLKKGDHIVLTGGLINGKTGNTNVIKVETV